MSRRITQPTFSSTISGRFAFPMACLGISAATTASASIINQAAGLVCNSNLYSPEAITKHSSVSPVFSFSTPKLSRVSRVGNSSKPNSVTIAHHRILVIRAAETESMATEKLGIKILKNPPESKLTELGVRSWPKWGCLPSKFPWTYSSKETCFLLKGKVQVYPDGSKEAVEIGAGDLVEFPKGMSCSWDVSEAVDKHYNFD
ncbi:unnamed protein product [Ilex paraguariensis]|uniref:(S)-ureidoglycine aminohydrolase cupin domain-containing protein n=1 Tax=Ilex paraguariensis TaxID=185542 RepID=A0ABC8UG42_9AQUA